MHAFLIVGKTEKSREVRTKELLKEYGAGRVLIFSPEGKSHTIESVRNLTRSLKTRRPVLEGIVIESAEKLTEEAANAFLKTLEEPPKNVLFILKAPARGQVLETIASRCAVIDLGTQSLDYSENDKQEHKKLGDLLENGGVGDRFLLAEKLEDREKAIGFVIGQIWATREKLTEFSGDKIKAKRYVAHLKALLQTKEDLEINVNVKLALTELMLIYGQ